MSSTSENFRRILGRVVQQDFVGRAGELDRIVAHAEPTNATPRRRVMTAS